MATIQKIVPSLWFDNNCEEAMNYYTSVFPDSRVVSITYYPEETDQEPLKNMAGKVLTGIFELNGQRFMALDGGPLFKFSEAISFAVSCEDQDEIDHYWEKLSAVPEAEQCGWCKDKFGVSWQIMPSILGELMADTDPQKVERVTNAFMGMKKFDIVKLKEAAAGK